MTNVIPNLPRSPQSMKWGTYPPGTLPLWVADLDFRPPASLQPVLEQYLDDGDLGYGLVPEGFRQAVAAWYVRRYGAAITADMVVPMPAVVPGLHTFLMAFGQRGGSYLTLTPVYPYFLTAGTTHDMTSIQIPLVRDGAVDTIDWALLESAITPSTRCLLLCHPHNPSGRVWNREELTRLADIAHRHDLSVLSDEIWSDWVLDGKDFIPFCELSPDAARRTVILGAPTKTFNIPALGVAWAIIPDPERRERFRGLIKGLLPSPTPPGVRATLHLLEHGEPWLRDAHKTVAENRDHALEFIRNRLKGVVAKANEATFLLWLDFRQTPLAKMPAREIDRRSKVVLSEGSLFGKGGEGFARINLGTTRENLEKALEGIEKSLANP